MRRVLCVESKGPSSKKSLSSQSCTARGLMAKWKSLWKSENSSLSGWLSLSAGARRRAAARHGDGVGRLLSGPLLAADLPRLCATDVQVWLSRCFCCCWSAVAAGARLENTRKWGEEQQKFVSYSPYISHEGPCIWLKLNWTKYAAPTLTSMALGRPPFLIQGWTSISSFFCSSEKRGWPFCSSLSFSLSCRSTVWMSLQEQANAQAATLSTPPHNQSFGNEWLVW